MQKLQFNDNWQYYRVNEENNRFAITLPHDAMIHEKRSPNSPGGINTGWFEAYDYVYEKMFQLPPEYKDKKIIVEFEGVYRNAEIYINEKKAYFHSYGYTGFYVDLTSNLYFDKENIIKVVVNNSDQPNSRWYSGAGIYRPVYLYIFEKEHIGLNGLKIRTLSYSPAVIEIIVKTEGEGEVKISVYNDKKELVYTSSDYSLGIKVFRAEIENTKLWSPDNPHLYLCRAKFKNDTQEENFGIRKIECDSIAGFCINGKRVILRGACIHHDNGLLGACAYDYAEERKIRILKEGGYNVIRSAHNPCSKAMLDACDRLGMLVMDEYVDMWYIHKTKYDYAANVLENYEQDLKDMIDKDYNHPSVIMYSVGNEVAETSEKKGIEFCQKLVDCCHKYDESRPVTCGVNIFFNYLYSLGFGVYSDKKAEKNKHVGSAFFNHIAGIVGDKFMKMGATLHGCDVKTRDAFSKMDVAGYNYGILRYKKDMKKYPDRVIVGSETFCKDTYKFYETAKKHPALIGDFVWAGMDYLGEASVGAWEYENYAPINTPGVGWITAGSGRIDITGKKTAEHAYTRVAYELDKIHVAVVPVDNAFKRHSPSAWKMTNAIQSWSWKGCEGKKTKIEVYARAYKAALYINNKLVGIKRIKKDCRISFIARYYDGVITAVAYDKANNEIGRTSLKTAEEKTVLSLTPEEKTVSRNGLCYVRMSYTDEKGTVKPLERGEIKVRVEGGKLIGLGNGCSYNIRGYVTDVTDTYYGEALAIIKPYSDSEKIIVYAEHKYGKSEMKVIIG